MTITELDQFTRGYVAALFFSSEDEVRECDEDNIAPEALAKIVADCETFQKKYAFTLRAYYRALVEREDYSNYERAGMDYYFTRNRHGAGFWDRGLGRLGDRLTEFAHADGEQDAYLGDDGKIYLQ